MTEGSGRIFEVDPATNAVAEVASGFKHAYAHTFTGDASTATTLWSVEMTDGTFDGEPGSDELHARVGRSGHRANDDGVEERVELGLLSRNLSCPVGEAKPAERVV